MHSIHISPIPRTVDQRNDTGARLNWLLDANEEERQHRALFRRTADEEQMLMMRRPVSTEKAYMLFGLLLGALPPAAIFTQILGYGVDGAARRMGADAGLFLLCLLMNIVCCLMGSYMGSKMSQMVKAMEHDSWTKLLVMSPLVGGIWGASTGALGGVFFFGIGAFFGAIIAACVGAVAFALFTPLHRLLARGGMMETRQFLPLACGITLTISALIFGL